jgi:hypothetical protein
MYLLEIASKKESCSNQPRKSAKSVQDKKEALLKMLKNFQPLRCSLAPFAARSSGVLAKAGLGSCH